MKTPTDFVWDDVFGDGYFYWAWDDREAFFYDLGVKPPFSLDELSRAVTYKRVYWSDGRYAYINYVMLQVDWQIIADRIEEKLKENE